MSEQRYVLIQDEDSHWYVCPADKQEEAMDYFQTVSAYWDSPPRWKDRDNEPEEPGYLVEVGGAPSLVTFTGYEIEE